MKYLIFVLILVTGAAFAKHDPSACENSVDINGNGFVDDADMAILRANMGQTGPNIADLDCNGIVNSFDLSILRSHFGEEV